MNTRELARALSERTGLPPSTTEGLLKALVDELNEQLQAGESVRLHGLGTFRRSWRARSTIRSLKTRRKVMIDGRFVVRFRAAKRLKDGLISLSAQNWRDPAHQAAWRLARTLLGDLELYAESRPDIAKGASPDEVLSACAEVFGDPWRRAVATYEDKALRVDPRSLYLVEAALDAWS